MFKAIISTLVAALVTVAVLPTVVFGQVDGPDYWWVQDNDGTMQGKSFRGICALSETDIWVVGEYGAVYHRSGALHQHPAWLKNENFPTGYQNYHFNDVCFVDATHGWIVGEKKQTLDPVYDPTSYSGVIYYTADGGNTLWSDQTDNVFPTFLIPTPFRKIKMVNLNNGYISCGNGVVLWTDDGGATWSRTTTDPWADDANVSNWYNGLWVNPFNDQQVWVSSDAFGILAKTDDGGNTWTPYQDIAFNVNYSFPTPPPTTARLWNQTGVF